MSFGPLGVQTTRPIVMGRNGIVVAGHHLAAQAGLDMLQSGGNAIDAAIATAAALAVLKPDACGLGSDLFLLYSEARTGKTYALNASGPAPQGATLAEYGASIPEHGLRASAVPGAVHGWENAIARFGRRSLAEVLAPAIALAGNGIPVSMLFARTLEGNRAMLQPFAATTEIFYPHGTAPLAGELLVQNDACHTLEAIVAGGAAAFYDGAFARALEVFARETNAPMRASDLSAYRSEWREPLSAAFRDVELVGQPPVSVGIVALAALKILESTPIATYADGTADFVHTHVEAMKLANADVRGHLGDPAFVTTTAATRLLENGYAERRGQAIDPARAQTFAPGELGAKTASDTSYMAVIDSEGNAVSLLQSIYAIFGSATVVPGTGVLMNNRMTGFSLDPASPNVLAPGKRTLHTLNPLMVRKDGRFLMCLGTPGAAGQVYTNSLLIMRLFERGYNLQRAVEAPRWFVGPDGLLQIESTVGQATLDELTRRGHRLTVLPALHPGVGGAGIVRINPYGVRESGADPRRESYAVAY
jgi:gamma-glutamyltranspeptidase / glutathione hydrolase